MKLIYDVEDSPKFKSNLVFALQQLLAIIAATLLVPTLVNNISGTEIMSQSAALFGAGAGTLFYIWCTKRKSPVFLGSSFAFISPLAGACAFGYFGILLGAFFAALVYVIIAIVIHFVGTKWVDKLLPPVIIGPTVALIGLSLCSSAIQNLNNTSTGKYNLLAVLCGLIAFGFGAFALWCGYQYYKLAEQAVQLNTIMPDATLAVTAMSVVVGALLSYLLYQMGLKNSRNKYGVDENGQPYKTKSDIEPSIEEIEEDEV